MVRFRMTTIHFRSVIAWRAAVIIALPTLAGASGSGCRAGGEINVGSGSFADGGPTACSLADCGGLPVVEPPAGVGDASSGEATASVGDVPDGSTTVGSDGAQALVGDGAPASVSDDAVTSGDDAPASANDGALNSVGDAGPFPLCTTTGPTTCNPTTIESIPFGPSVIITRTTGDPPKAQGGAPSPGTYQLVSETLYGDPLPDLATRHVGDSYNALLGVDCDTFNIIFTGSGGGSGNTCGRLVPHDLSLTDLLSTSGSLNQTPYSATATTLTLIEPTLYRDRGNLLTLGVFTQVDEYVLISSAGNLPAGAPGDLSPPNPSGARDPRCPAQPPANDQACDPRPAPLECEYGGDALGRCTTKVFCVLQPDGTFRFQIAPGSCGANAAACPASYAEGVATVTADGGRCAGPLVCNYVEGVCGCGSLSSASAWACRARADVGTASDPGSTCPVQRPLLGDGCTLDEQECLYDSPCDSLSLGPDLACVNGYWEELDGVTNCPAQGP
jgi:hypothetical protein